MTLVPCEPMLTASQPVTVQFAGTAVVRSHGVQVWRRGPECQAFSAAVAARHESAFQVARRLGLLVGDVTALEQGRLAPADGAAGWAALMEKLA